MASDHKILRLDQERLDELRPLWLALRDHHGEIMPELGELRDDDDSWQRRRENYRQWLEQENGFVLAVEHEGRLIAYAFTHECPGSPTWKTPDRIADLATLAVLPEYRGHGIGRLLMDEVFKELRSRGIKNLVIGVVSTNSRAIEFYRRLGFKERLVSLFGPVPSS